LRFGSAIKGKRRVVRRLLSGVMTFGDRGLPVPLYGSSNRQGLEGDCNHRAKPDPDAKEPCPEVSEQIMECVDGRGDKETAGTGAMAPIPADSSPERVARSGLGQPEGISFTKGSRGDWIRTSDLTVPNSVANKAGKGLYVHGRSCSHRQTEKRQRNDPGDHCRRPADPVLRGPDQACRDALGWRKGIAEGVTIRTRLQRLGEGFLVVQKGPVLR